MVFSREQIAKVHIRRCADVNAGLHHCRVQSDSLVLKSVYYNFIIQILLIKKKNCGFSMGSNQYWAGRVYDMCVYYMTGAPEGSPKVVLWRSRESNLLLPI